MSLVFLSQPRNSSFWISELKEASKNKKKCLILSNGGKRKRSLLNSSPSSLSLLEFWEKCLFKVSPQTKVMSSLALETLCMEWLKERYEREGKIQSSSSTSYKTLSLLKQRAKEGLSYLLEMMPVFSHPQAESLIKEELFRSSSFFSKGTLSLHAHSLWQQEFFDFWKNSLHSNWTSKEWTLGFLSYHNLLEEIQLEEELHFDLGLNVSPFDVDSIDRIRHKNQVFLYAPSPPWSSFYKKDLYPYSFFKEGKKFFFQTDFSREKQNSTQKDSVEKKDQKQEKEKDSKKIPSSAFLHSSPSFQSLTESVLERLKPSFRHHLNSLCEVKDALLQVRVWLDQKVPSEKMALLSPSPKLYKPLLETYLKSEGLEFFSHEEESSFLSYPFVLEWLSKIKREIGTFDFLNLSLAFTPLTLFLRNSLILNLFNLFSIFCL